MTGTLSTESVLITEESNWIQTKPVIWFVWFVLFVLLNQTNRRQSRAVICQQDAEKVRQQGRDGPVSPLCSRNARSQKTLVGRAQWGTHPGHPGDNVHEQAWKDHLWSLAAALPAQGASQGEEAVLAAQGGRVK
jgi:hypothetical protein